MEDKDILRRVQFRQGSFVVTIPLKLAYTHGIKKDQYVKFESVKGWIAFKPVDLKDSKKESVEVEKEATRLDDNEEIPSHKKQLGEILKKPKDNRSRLEKLRMK